MSADFQPDDVISKANISEKFTNLKESLLPDDVYAFQQEVEKGNVDVLTEDLLEKSFGGKMMYKPQHTALGEKIDELIQKGETTFLTEDEADFVEKAGVIYRSAQKMALPICKAGTSDVLAHVEVFVSPVEAAGTSED